MFGQSGVSDAFGRRAVKNIGIRTDIRQTFAETGTTTSDYNLVFDEVGIRLLLQLITHKTVLFTQCVFIFALFYDLYVFFLRRTDVMMAMLYDT